MAKSPKNRPASAAVKKLRATLTEIAATSPSVTLREGESFVCSVCQLPVKLCNSDPLKNCEFMRLEGTQLQLLHRAGKPQKVNCIRCGGPIPSRILARNPLTELCPSCQAALSKSKSPKRSKGVPQ